MGHAGAIVSGSSGTAAGQEGGPRGRRRQGRQDADRDRRPDARDHARAAPPDPSARQRDRVATAGRRLAASPAVVAVWSCRVPASALLGHARCRPRGTLVGMLSATASAPSCPGPTTASGDAVEPPAGSRWWRGAVVGVLTGLASLVVVVGPGGARLAGRAAVGAATGGRPPERGPRCGCWCPGRTWPSVTSATISLVPRSGWPCSSAVAWLGAREADGRRVHRR